MIARTARLPTTVATASVTVMGSVSDPSGYPLAGITIVLLDEGLGSALGTTTTDDVGGYRFTRVLAVAGDDCRVEATDESGAHVSTCSGLTIGSGSTTTHHTTMPVAGYIQGKVTSQDGTTPDRPATHVCVTAAGENTVHSVYVSATGRFRLGGLPVGSYTVAFHDEGVRIDEDTHATTVRVTAGRTATIQDQVLHHPARS